MHERNREPRLPSADPGLVSLGRSLSVRIWPTARCEVAYPSRVIVCCDQPWCLIALLKKSFGCGHLAPSAELTVWLVLSTARKEIAPLAAYLEAALVNSRGPPAYRPSDRALDELCNTPPDPSQDLRGARCKGRARPVSRKLSLYRRN
jgi:hypothetical protein